MAMVHIIGAGISGLAAATQLAEAHVPVRLYEATAHAGGRARSSHDARFGAVDHGLHVMDRHSPELLAYLRRIGAQDSLVATENPIQFPTAPLVDYLALAPLLIARRGKAESFFPGDTLLRDTWAVRFARLVLHTPLSALPATALRRALWQKLRHARANRTSLIVRHSLRESFITPALAHLDQCGASVYFNQSLKSLGQADGQITMLHFARQKIAVAAEDVVILATTAPAAQQLVPGLRAPAEGHSAITVHFEIAHREPPHTLAAPSDAPVDLIRYQPGRISLSIRIATYAWQSDAELLAARLWRWLTTRHPYLAEMPQPPHSLWREKYAGHRLTENGAVVLPPLPARLLLAGDWLAENEPGSLENAAASGHRAATAALALIGPRRQHRQG